MDEIRLNNDDNSFDELSALMNGETGIEKEIEIEEIPSQCKFITPVCQSCNICGEWIMNTQDWFAHHMSEKHKKVIKCLNLFRSKCIEHRNDADDASPSTENKSLSEKLRSRIKYTQELFEVHSTSNLICGVCGAGVFDAENHLLSTKHNEAYMNLLYVGDLVAVKEKCIKSTGVDWRQYETSLVQQLERHQPRIDETPLEIYILKSDESFTEWMWKYVIALSNFTHPQEFTMSYQISLELLLSADILKEKSIDQCSFWQNDCCTICRSKHFSRDSFKKHVSNDSHLKKVKIFDFLRFAEKFKIISGMCSEQIRIESADEPCLGVETVTEFVDSYDQSRLWICSVCFLVNEDISEIVAHVTSAKHLMNCLDIFYPGIKLSAKTGRDMNEEVKRYAREIQVNRAIGKIRLAELVDTTTEHIFQLLGYSRKSDAVSTSDSTSSAISDSQSQLPDGESEPQILFSDRNEEMLWCDTCWMMIQVKKNDTGTKTVWAKHVSLKSHQDKKEIRKEFVLEKKNFVEEKVAANIREAVAKKDVTFLGLEEIIERKIKNKDGSPIHDCICFLCAEKFHVAQFTAHVTGQSHVLQYLHKNDRNLMRKILNEAPQSAARKKLIDDYVSKKKSVRETIRVYNPTRAELLVAEYERLKQQIAEKERLLEQKRKEKEKEAEEDRRKAELQKVLQAEEERKRVEAQKLLELQKRETERQAAEERQRVEKEKALLQIQKINEQQQIEARKKMDQQRLLDMMQREQQRQKEEEKKKLDQQRILQLMQKEKAKMDEDDVKKAENEEKNRKAQEEAEKRKQKEKLIAAAISISKTLPVVTPAKVGQSSKPVSPTKNSEPKWVSMAQSDAPNRIVMEPKPTSDTRTVLPRSSDKPEPPDVLIELLAKSTMIPIPYPETAYIQPILNNSVEHLVGLQHIYEFECLDSNYEPGYFCRLCSSRMMARDLSKHVTSSEHRMKYFEHSYEPFYQNIVANYPNPGARSAVIKQYAGQVERQEGRKRIDYRLTMRVSNTVLSTKKPSLFCSPDAMFSAPPPPSTSAIQYLGSVNAPMTTTMPPPFALPLTSIPPPTMVPPPATMDVCPPGISPPLPNMKKSSDYSPIVFPPPPPSLDLPKSKQYRRSSKDGDIKISSNKQENYRDASWDDKCNKFLQKLTKSDKSSSKETKQSSSSKTDSTRRSAEKEKKNDSRVSGVSSSKISDQQKSSSSRKRSSSIDRNNDERRSKCSPERRKIKDEKVLLSGPVMETKMRDGAKRQRSRSPRPKSPKNKKRRSKTPPRDSRDQAKSKTYQSSSKSLDKGDSGKVKVEVEAIKTVDNQSVDVPSLSAEDINILQQLADTNPQALEKLVLENPSILTALLEHNNAMDEIAAKKLVPVVAKLPTPKPVPPPEAPEKPSFDSLVSSLLGGQQNLGFQQVQAIAGSCVPSQDTLEILLHMFAEETNKQQKQAEQQRMLLELLQQVGAPSEPAAASAKTVYDYSHGRNGEESGKSFEIDDLIKEASANVQQAQKVGINTKKLPSSPTKPAQQTADQWKKLSKDDRPTPRKLDKINDVDDRKLSSSSYRHFQMPSETNSFDKMQHDKQHDAERRRKELMDNLANELISSSNNSLPFGRTTSTKSQQSANPTNQMIDLDKLLNLTKPQTRVQPVLTGGIRGPFNQPPPNFLAQSGLFGPPPGANQQNVQQSPLAMLGLVQFGQSQGGQQNPLAQFGRGQASGMNQQNPLAQFGQAGGQGGMNQQALAQFGQAGGHGGMNQQALAGGMNQQTLAQLASLFRSPAGAGLAGLNLGHGGPFGNFR